MANARFKKDLSSLTRNFLHQTGLISDWFVTPLCNSTVVCSEDLEKPTTRVFREQSSRHIIVFTIDSTTGHVTMTMPDVSSVWEPFADELLALVLAHEVVDFKAEQAALAQRKALEAWRQTRIDELAQLPYHELFKFFLTHGLYYHGKRDKQSLLRRLSTQDGQSVLDLMFVESTSRDLIQ